MKKAIDIYIKLFFLGTLSVLGQSSPDVEINANDLPKEDVFIHYNASLLLAGEYLYYEVYCRNAVTKRSSSISIIAYVEMIGENGESVFHHKIFLEDGRGQGDFFIPVSVKSGNYKLIGYTQWMKNDGVDSFFQGDISIVNPYRSDQTPLLASTNDSLFQGGLKRDVEIHKDRGYHPKKVGMLSLNDSIFGNREKVLWTLKAELGASLNGTYSVSVRKTDPFVTSQMVSTEDFNASETEKSSNTGDAPYIPEMRGDLISGSVVSIKGNSPLKDIKVGMSMPGEEPITKVANTDKQGIFYVNIDKKFLSNEAIFQVLGKEKDNYRITIDRDVSLDYSGLSFYNFTLAPQMEDLLIKRSVHNQIENAYFSVKPDTLVTAESSRPDYLNKMDFYDLDDYTRFPTVRETLVEIVDNVWSRKAADENYRIQVRNHTYDKYVTSQSEPLVLVDGILVQNHKYLLDYDARKIKKIGVLQDKYILGLQIFQGVVAMETIDGDFSLPPTDGFTTTQIAKPLERKKYFSPQYGDSLPKKERIPDFRHQLFWKPNILINKKETTFSFYTSDVKGDFEISLEGFTVDGKPVSLTQSFRVE